MRPPLHVWRIRVFGGFSIEPLSDSEDPRRLDAIFQRRQTLTLLAILAVAGPNGVARDRLLELLWLDGDTIQNRNALAQLLFRTRRTLGRTALTGRQTLRLSDQGVSSDLSEFWVAIERDEPGKAVALYKGPLLDGIHDWETPALARWAAEERARLDSAYRSALERMSIRSPGAPSTKPRVGERRATQSAALLIIAVLIAMVVSSFYVDRRVERRPQAVVVPPFDNETGDSAFDTTCRQAAHEIVAAMSSAHIVQRVTSVAPAQLGSDAVSVQASLFRMGTDSIVLFVRFVRPPDGRILAAEPPLVVAAAHRDELIALARQRVLGFFTGHDIHSTATR